MDSGQDPLVLCLHCHLSLCSMSICITETSSILWLLSTPTEHHSRRDSTVHAILRPSGTLVSLAKQLNKPCLQVILLPLPFVSQFFSSSHVLALFCSGVFCHVKTVSTCTRFGSCRRPDGSLQDVPSHLTCQCLMPRTDTTSSTIAPVPPWGLQESTTDRCHAERPALQLTNCPMKPKRPWRKVRSHPPLPFCFAFGRHRLL